MVLGRIASILAAEACTLTGQTETASFRWEQLVKIFLAWIRCLRNIRNWCDTSRNHATLKMDTLDTLCTVEEKEVEMITSNFQPFTFKCAGLHELCLFGASIQIPVHMYVREKTPAQLRMSSQTSTTFIYTLESHHAIRHQFRLLSAIMDQVIALFCSLPSPTWIKQLHWDAICHACQESCFTFTTAGFPLWHFATSVSPTPAPLLVW